MRLFLALVLSALSSIGWAWTPTPHPAIPIGQLPRVVTPEHYALDLRIDPAANAFSGTVSIDLTVQEPTRHFWLHGRELHITAATLAIADAAPVDVTIKVADAAAGVLSVDAPARIPVGKATLRIAYTAPFGTDIKGAFKTTVGNDAYIVTQFEPLYARFAFPGFDEPAFKTPYDITLTVPADQKAVANTRQIEEQRVAGGWKQLRFATTERLPTYLIAFAVGPWDIVDAADIPPNAVRTAPLKLRGIAPHGRGGEMTYALQHTGEQVAALEEYFGIPYPFDKLDLLATPESSFGAMENAGLIVFAEGLLLNIEKASTGKRHAYWATTTHELAHQWFGNLVTMPWWDDLWLNESFATWMEARILRTLKPELQLERELRENGIWAMADDSLASARRMHEPVHTYVDALSVFDGVTYSKGAAVLAMFERYIGEDAFRTAIRRHLGKFARGNATSAELIASLAAASPQPASIDAALHSFTDQAGAPILATQLRCDDGRPTLAVRQQRYIPLGSTADANTRWTLPMCVRYPSAGGTRRQCVLLSNAEETIALDTATCPAWVHPNADGAGYYRFAPVAEDQPALAASFASWTSSEQRVYGDSLVAAYNSGLLSTGGFLDAVPALAQAPDRNVALSPTGRLEWMRQYLAVDTAQRDAVTRLIVHNYQPRLDAIGINDNPDDDDETRLLRRDLIGLLAPLPPARALREQLAKQGRQVLGLAAIGSAAAGGRIHPDAVSIDQRAMSLRMAGELGGSTEFDTILRYLAVQDDATLRGQLIAALGASRDPALAERARMLSIDGTLRASEMASVLFTQVWQQEQMPALLTWLDTHFDALFARAPAGFRPYLPNLETAWSCSDADATAVVAKYTRLLRDVEGGPIALAQMAEGVQLCAAKLDHHRAAGFGSALRAYE